MNLSKENVALKSVPWYPVKPVTPVHDIGGKFVFKCYVLYCKFEMKIES